MMTPYQILSCVSSKDLHTVKKVLKILVASNKPLIRKPLEYMLSQVDDVLKTRKILSGYNPYKI